MKIFHENWDWITQIDFKNSKVVSKKHIDNFFSFYSKNFENLNVEGKLSFLLNEKKFNFYSFSIFDNFSSKITISKLNDYINEKIEENRINNPDLWRLASYDIENVFINWEKSDFLLWKKWKIYFEVNMLYLENETINSLKVYLWNKFLSNPKIKVFPSTYFTVKFIKDKLRKDSVNLLYIQEDQIKLIKIKEWKIYDISFIKLWYSTLRSIFNDNWVLDSFYSCINNTYDCDIPDASKHSISFYIDTIIKRLDESLWDNKNLILFSRLTNSSYFYSYFSKQFSRNIPWYLLPYNNSNTLNNFWFKFSQDEIDIITYLNYW